MKFNGGLMTDICIFCKSYFFSSERNTSGIFNLCCNGGNVKLSNFVAPTPLMNELFKGSTPQSKIFLKKSRLFNRVYAQSTICPRKRNFYIVTRVSRFQNNGRFLGPPYTRRIICRGLPRLSPQPSSKWTIVMWLVIHLLEIDSGVFLWSISENATSSRSYLSPDFPGFIEVVKKRMGVNHVVATISGTIPCRD